MSDHKKRLLELTNAIAKLEPWEWLYDIDIFAIQPRQYLEPFFVSTMGNQGNCYGYSIYYGTKGFQDFDALSKEDTGLPVSYLMSDISCYTCYFANEEELDDEALWEFQEYGLEPDRKDRYFYYLSFEPRFYPYHLNDEQIKIVCDVLEGFLFALNEWMDEHSIDPSFENNEIGFACEDEDGWVISTVMRPEVERDYDRFSVEDDYMDILKSSNRLGNSIALELIYCNAPVFDDEGIYERPVNPLMFVAQDRTSKTIMGPDFLSVDTTEAEFVMDWFTNYIEEIGIPDEVHCHNPYIVNAIQDVCDELKIEIVEDALENLNEFFEQVLNESIE